MVEAIMWSRLLWRTIRNTTSAGLSEVTSVAWSCIFFDENIGPPLSRNPVMLWQFFSHNLSLSHVAHTHTHAHVCMHAHVHTHTHFQGQATFSCKGDSPVIGELMHFFVLDVLFQSPGWNQHSLLELVWLCCHPCEFKQEKAQEHIYII